MNGLDFPIDNGMVRIRESITKQWYWFCSGCQKSSPRSGPATSAAEGALHHIRRSHREKVAA